MYNVNFKRLFVTISLILCTPVATFAEEVIIPVGQQASEKQAIERPVNGIIKSQVEESFGAPELKTPSVGEPAISSWEYPDYVVYFENDRVLHSVLKREEK